MEDQLFMTPFDGSLATSLFGKVRGLLFNVVGGKRVEWKEEMILRDMLLELNDSCEQYGMKVNSNKTKTMVKERKMKKVNLRILNEAVEQVDSGVYYKQ
ncbi:hypothetical protein ANN_10593 [Periplaneta americana]|uniref:Reverse transcriptase domain-containing protein n=1 Tax=Periplaneta americana TaxID=6978 RepID=A0ABQ8TTA7_PERAM|nr:hypothetical protein ANN_10593 [Periplaneta americana]